MKYKYLGVLDTKIADYWNISEHKNKPILVFDDRETTAFWYIWNNNETRVVLWNIDVYKLINQLIANHDFFFNKVMIYLNSRIWNYKTFEILIFQGFFEKN